MQRVQQIVGSILFYSRAVDNKLGVALSDIGSQQASATKVTNAALNQLLDYVAMYPDDGIIYRASDMVLAAHSDATYLNVSKARSRAGAHIMLSENDLIPRANGSVLTVAQIIKFVMSSAAEAELAALFITAKEMVPLRQTLIEMGWPQPKAPIQTDNSTAVGVTNSTIVPRRTKSMDMRLHWLHCRELQGQFRYSWAPGAINLADYSTKHNPPQYHEDHCQMHAGVPGNNALTARVYCSKPLQATEPSTSKYNLVGRVAHYSKGRNYNRRLLTPFDAQSWFRHNV